MKLQQVLSITRKAVETYQMIQEGDKIAVGISGGKDSLTLLYALWGLRRFYPQKFELEAITVDLGFEGFELGKIQELCESLEVPYHVIRTSIGQIVFEERKESNPCSLCAKLRKGALNGYAKSCGCNKIAYAHQQDDAIETMLLSLIYEGRFYTFAPINRLDRTGLTLIRPLLFMKEKDVIGFSNKYQLPVSKNPCPADHHTRREYVKKLLHEIQLENPGARERMFTAIQNANLQDWIISPSPVRTH